MARPNPPRHQDGERGNDHYPPREGQRRIADALQTFAGDYKASEAEATKHNRKIRRWTRAATIGAWIYTLITVGILVFSILGVREAGRAADAATNQAQTSADTEERQLRPYLFVQPGAWSGSLSAETGGTITA